MLNDTDTNNIINMVNGFASDPMLPENDLSTSFPGNGGLESSELPALIPKIDPELMPVLSNAGSKLANSIDSADPSIESASGEDPLIGSAVAGVVDDLTGEDSPPPLNFNDYSVDVYNPRQNKNVTFSISEPGDSLQIVGNGWKKIEFPYTITPDTVLEFDFKSEVEGEVHAIGFDTDDLASNKQQFQLYGTQNFGIRDFRNYGDNAGEWQHYQIPVGQFYTGQMNYLTFIHDHDVPNPTAESLFANIKVYESPQLLTVKSQDGNGNLVSNDYSVDVYNPRQNKQVIFSTNEQGDSLQIVGNGWKKIEFPYTITPDTVLEFDFKSEVEGEVHAIGFDTDDLASNKQQFQLYGTQNFGIRDFRDYENNAGELRHYQIPVGQFYTGQMNYLTFIHDHDVPNPTAESLFANIKVYESPQLLTVKSQDSNGDLVSNDYSVDVYNPRQHKQVLFSTNEQDDSLQIVGNGWKKIEFPYTITPDTVLEFDFKSEVEGEVHAIGFDTDDLATNKQQFQLYGTQNFGIRDFRDYENNAGELRHYQIPVGQFYTGQMNYLTFIHDHDVPNPTAESLFANIKVYESSPDDPDPGELPIDSETGVEYNPGELLVKLNPDVTDAQVQSLTQTVGAISIESLVEDDPNADTSLEQWYLASFDQNADLQEARNVLAGDDLVETVELDYLLEINFVPNDPDFNQQWALHNTGQDGGTENADINAPEAWETQQGSRDVVVAVIDSGVDYDHLDLGANIWTNPGESDDGIDNDGNGKIDDVRGWDFGENDSDPMDSHGHGTNTVGIIGAVGNNAIGVSGVSPNVSIMPLKIMNSDDKMFVSEAVKAIDYAVQMGADAINASWGIPLDLSVMENAISRANDADVLFVAAAGNGNNDNDNKPYYPANYDLPNVISVAATDRNDQLASFSNYGTTTVDLGAPGVDILTTVPGNGYEVRSGTSMAVPHVAGAAALLLAADPNLSATDLKQTLMDTTVPIASLTGKTVSGGRLSLAEDIPEPEPLPVAVINATVIADNTGEFDSISGIPAINDSGNVAFYAEDQNTPGTFSSRRGIFTGDGQTNTSRFINFYDISNGNQILPTILPQNDFDINNSDEIAYQGQFINSDGSIVTPMIVASNGFTTGLDSSPVYSAKSAPVINNSGTVAYTGGYPGSVYSYGIWRNSEDLALVNIGTPNQLIEAQISTFGSLSNPVINDSDTIAFIASRSDDFLSPQYRPYVWPDTVSEGVFIHSNGQFTSIADDSGPISDFGETGSDNTNLPPTLFYPTPPDINNNNTVAFFANLDSGNSGIFTSNGSSLTTIADTSDRYTSFGNLAINDNNTVAFFANLDSGDRGIFTGPDPVADRVVAIGDTLLGSTITSLGFSHKGLNNADQLAFYARLADGTQGIFRIDIDVSSEPPADPEEPPADPEEPPADPEQEWIRQLGTSGNEGVRDIATDSSGNVYISGFTRGNLAATNAGLDDILVAKYDNSGNLLWTQQFGTSWLEQAKGIATDSTGNVYITGYTNWGNLAATNAGNNDAFIAKYDSSGNQLWIQQFGTSEHDTSTGIATDSAGNVYITVDTDGNLGGINAGNTDVLLAKYDSSGNQLWTQQFGTSSDEVSRSIATDSAGNVYITGWTRGNLGGSPAGQWDVFVTKYDSSGNQLWAQQFGTSQPDTSYGIATDSAGNVYLTGATSGDLGGTNAGSSDGFVVKYDSSGNQLWTQLFGSSDYDVSEKIATDSAGNVYVTGSTSGDLGGTNAGGGDGFVIKYDSSGNQLWIQQFGTASHENSNGIVTDSAGNIYLTGETSGNLGGANSGENDIWVAKFS